jgi:hypothetical protein
MNYAAGTSAGNYTTGTVMLDSSVFRLMQAVNIIYV